MPVIICFVLLLLLEHIVAWSISNYRPKSHFPAPLGMALKYEPDKKVTVSVSRPLGVVFEEVEENSQRGVYVYEVSEGNIKATGTIHQGMMLLSVNDQDVRRCHFDQVMDLIKAVSEDTDLVLTFMDSNDIFRGKAILNVKLPDGGGVRTIECLKGQMLRDVLTQAQLDVYDLRGKMTNCGGGGVCGTCVVNVETAEDDDWEPRSTLEKARLKRYSENARLSCCMPVEGDATVSLRPPKAS